MRQRLVTLVSYPAPPALGSLSGDALAEAMEDDEVVLDLARRRGASDPPASEIRPRAAAANAEARAEIAAASLAATLDARAVVIHTHDPKTKELRVVGAWGENASGLLGETGSSDDDFVASTVITNREPLTMPLTAGLPRVAPRRLGVLGAARSLVAVPILSGGRCVGVIELIDVEAVLFARVVKACAAVGESVLRAS
jgi:hypothetical protein